MCPEKTSAAVLGATVAAANSALPVFSSVVSVQEEPLYNSTSAVVGGVPPAKIDAV